MSGGKYEISAFAPVETQLRAQRLRPVAELLCVIFDFVKRGFTPDKDQPISWFERAIRIAVGVVILIFLGALLSFVVGDLKK